MDVEDITAALAARDMATIKETCLALANYPKQEAIAGLRAGNAMTFLEAAAEALQVDYSIMPHDTCEALGLAQGAFYTDGAAVVLETIRYSAECSA